MKNVYDLTITDFEEFLINNNEKKYRASQIMDWLYVKEVKKFSLMTNLSKDLIKLLEDNFIFPDMKIIKEEKDLDVSKFLIKLFDGNYIEAVLMHHDYGESICISSQVGCNMSCAFCESGRLKKVRNLTSGEMVYQIMLINNVLDKKITHVVVMGIGEPFDNFENLIKFIDIINYNKGINIGSRHITVSTCGVVPRIYDFMKIGKEVNLAISLHAPTDEIRNKIMPINKIYNIEKLMKAVKDYLKMTNRRVTFEYIMLKGINDSKEDAVVLAKLLRGINCYVNLIPYNETENIGFKRSDMKTILDFYDILKKEKITVTIRREFGTKVSAACGQLRAKEVK